MKAIRMALGLALMVATAGCRMTILGTKAAPAPCFEIAGVVKETGQIIVFDHCTGTVKFVAIQPGAQQQSVPPKPTSKGWLI